MKMTRKNMITACIDNQIERGIIKEEERELQIKWRLKGFAGSKPMNFTACERWYNEVFGE